MSRNRDENESRYERILLRIQNLRLPLLTLDRKWHLLFSGEKPKTIQAIEREVNDTLKNQARIKEEKKKLNSLKQQLMQQIVANMNAQEDSTQFRVMEKSRDLIEEINDKLILLENDELDIPIKLREKMQSLRLKQWSCFMTALQKIWRKSQNWNNGLRRQGKN